jgi:hypothetical protein
MLVQLNSKVADSDHGGSGALESHQVKYGTWHYHEIFCGYKDDTR